MQQATSEASIVGVEKVVTRKTRRKRRKRSPRPTRYRGRLKKPGTAAAMKALWATPEFRERMAQRPRGDGTRQGIPDGMRKAQAEPLIQEAKESAARTMAELEKAGVLDDADAQAREALQTTIQIMREPGAKEIKLRAARQVLEWTKAKPESKSQVTVNAAEEWLKAVAVVDDREGEAS